MYDQCAACGNYAAVQTRMDRALSGLLLGLCMSCRTMGWKNCDWCGAAVAPPGTRMNEDHGFGVPRWRCERDHHLHAVCAACIGHGTTCPESDEAKVAREVMA